MDGSFHSPEWHAARLASLETSHTVTWEEFKRKQKVICCTQLLMSMLQIPLLILQHEYCFPNSELFVEKLQ